MLNSNILLKATFNYTGKNHLGYSTNNTILALQWEHYTTTPSASSIYSATTFAKATSNIYVDCGDGTRKILRPGDDFNIQHSYASGTYTVTVCGNMPRFVDCELGYYYVLSVLALEVDEIYDLYINPRLFTSVESNGDKLYCNIGTTLPSPSMSRCGPKIHRFYPNYLSNFLFMEGNLLGHNYTGLFNGVVPLGYENMLPRLDLEASISNESSMWYLRSDYNKGPWSLAPWNVDDQTVPKAYTMFNTDRVSDLIGPKLKGGDFGTEGDITSTVFKYTYSVWPNKTLSHILITGNSYIGEIGFDVTNRTLMFKSKIGTGTAAEDYTGYRYICLKFVFTDGSYDVDYFRLIGRYYTCLLKNTLIKTIDGDKYIQDIQYDDLILVHDFYRGKLSYQLPGFIDREHETGIYAIINLSDGTSIRMSGSHDFYNVKLNMHQTISITDIEQKTFNKSDWQFIKINPDNSYSYVDIDSIELVYNKETTYSLYTSGTQTYFANNILCSNKDFNLFGETKDNKLDLTKLNAVKNNLIYTKEQFEYEFGKISSTVYYSQLQHILYNGNKLGLGKDSSNLINNVYGSYEKAAKQGVDWLWSKPKELPNIDGQEACYIALMDNDKVLSKDLYKVGEVVDLPKSDKGWYCVADTNIYFDKYEIKTNTVLEKVV